jgi:TonB family protein
MKFLFFGMKRLLFFCCVLLWINSFSQIPVRLYFNQNWQLCKKESAAYYRDAKFDTTMYQYVGDVEDYTISGNLVMKGFYQGKMRNGEFTSHYGNGTIESIGPYSHDLRIGTWKYFYPNGIQKTELEFFPPNNYTIKFFNDSTGKQVLRDGTGKWEERYEYLDASPPLIVINQGAYKNGKKNGKWICRLESGKKIYEETYRDGEFFGGYNFDSDGKKKESYNEPFKNHMTIPQKFQLTENLIFVSGVDQSDYPFLTKLPGPKTHAQKPRPDTQGKESDEVFTVIEVSAMPEGGFPNFYKTIAEIQKYPAEAKKKRIAGRVFVEFVINKDGSLSDFHVIQGIGGGCDEEAIRCIKDSTTKCPWKPGTQRGIAVKQRYTLPIIFRL